MPETHVFTIIKELDLDGKKYISKLEQLKLLERMNARMPRLITSDIVDDIVTEKAGLAGFIKELLFHLACYWDKGKQIVHVQYILEKTPSHALHLPLIKKCIPNAKIIHCVRNPLDVIASIDESFERKSTLIEKINLCRRFHKSVERHEEICDDLLEYRYEDLITDYDLFVKQIKLSLAIESDENLSVGMREGTFKMEHELWKSNEIGQILDRRGRWRRVLDDSSAWLVSTALKKTFRKFEYEMINTSRVKKIRASCRAVLSYFAANVQLR